MTGVANASTTTRTRLRRRPRWWVVLAAAAPIVFAVLFHLRPVAAIIWLGLWGSEGSEATSALQILARPGIRRVIGFTFWQAGLSTILTMVIALPTAHLVATREFRGRRLLETALTVPFVLPTTVVGAAFLALLGPTGPLPGNRSLVGTLPAILLAHVFFNQAVVVRLLGAFWSGLDPDLRHAAATLGASPRQRFLRVLLPLSLPAIASAAAVVFLFTFTSLGVVLILGGPGLTTLEVEILRQTRDLLDLPSASVLALVQLSGVLLALGVAGRLQRRAARTLPRGRAVSSRRPLRTTGDRWWLSANLAIVATLLGLPILVLVLRSVRVGDMWTLAAWSSLGELRRGSLLATTPGQAIANTLWFAVQATVLALVLGTLASVAIGAVRHRRVGALDALLALPLGTSAVTVGFGFLITLDTPPLDLRSSAALVPIAHAVVAMPFVIRVMLPAIRALDADQRGAARTLGAGPLAALLRIDLPALAAPLATSAAFAFAISAGEFGATVFVARPESTTAPLLVLRLLSQPGPTALAQAMAVSVILLVVVSAAVLLAGWVTDRTDLVGASPTAPMDAT